MAQSKKRKISPDTNIRADNLNVSDLIQVCKFIGLSRISGLRKIELLYLIDVAIRETGGPIYIDSLEGYLLPPVYINEHDPISMESLTTRKPCHIFTLDNNFDEPRHVHRFDPVSMVTMIVSTGSISNPFTRKPMSNKDICRLEFAYFSCLRCISTSPMDLHVFLKHRPDIKPRLVLYSAESEQTLKESGEVPADFLPWEQSQHLLQYSAECTRRYRAEREFDQTDQYLAERFSSDLGALDFICGNYPSALPSHIQRTYSSLITRYYIPAVLERLAVICQWNIVSGQTAIKELVDKANAIRESDPETFRANVWTFTATFCIEKIFALFNTQGFFDVRANEEDRRRFNDTIRSYMNTYNCSSMIHVSLAQLGVGVVV